MLDKNEKKTLETLVDLIPYKGSYGYYHYYSTPWPCSSLSVVIRDYVKRLLDDDKITRKQYRNLDFMARYGKQPFLERHSLEKETLDILSHMFYVMREGHNYSAYRVFETTLSLMTDSGLLTREQASALGDQLFRLESE